MKSFGKLTASREEVVDDLTNVSVSVLILRDKNGVDWLDIVKDNPHAYYIAIDANGRIFSMTDDASQSQITGVEIIGIDENYGYTFGPGGTVYGKIWDGSAIVEPGPQLETIPDEISRRQFFQQLAVMGITTRDEALAAMKGGVIPAPLQAIIDQLPTEDDKFNAQMLVIGAQSFNRTNPLADIVRQAMNWTIEQKDDFWRQAAKL